jgi:hypothetical protein
MRPTRIAAVACLLAVALFASPRETRAQTCNGTDALVDDGVSIGTWSDTLVQGGEHCQHASQ